MPSHMGVQTFATERNSQVEFFIHFILGKFAEQLTKLNLISEPEVIWQKHYTSEIASDVWDHVIMANQIKAKKPLQIWCQTTCYKGNEGGTAEPNKTYEVRETLVEGLSIRQLTDDAKEHDVRTLHFTVGDKRYTYQWFLSLKSATYDKSIYIGDQGFDIFEALYKLFVGNFTETAKSAVLETCIESQNEIGLLITDTLTQLEQWYVSDGMPKSHLADLQWQLIKKEKSHWSDRWPAITHIHGADIKGRANRFLLGDDSEGENDPLIPQTAAKILKKKPFLATAISVVSDWPLYVKQLQQIYSGSHGFEDFLYKLWEMPSPLNLITRRILLRIHSRDAIAYVQDREVNGITEHNLYAGAHSDAQVKAICLRISQDLKTAGLGTEERLIDAIQSRGKTIINQARWFEAKNGTAIKPSFEYVELALIAAGFNVLSPKQAGFSALGYHAAMSTENVGAYTNLKVITDKNNKMLGVLKAKFFRVQEFPRRCKEEAFVGLTLKYAFKDDAFIPRLKVPLIMFVDMAYDCKAPEYAIKRLICFGWNVIFSIEDLLNLIKPTNKQTD